MERKNQEEILQITSLDKVEKIVCGIDLSGVTSNNTAVVEAIKYGNDVMLTIIKKHPFNHGKVKEKDFETKELDDDAIYLCNLLQKHEIYIDAPVDDQGVLDSNRTVKYFWQKTKRPVDMVFEGLALNASWIGSVTYRMQYYRHYIEKFDSSLTNNLFETYPAGSLRYLKNNKKLNLSTKYKGGYVKLENGKWVLPSEKEAEELKKIKSDRSSFKSFMRKCANLQKNVGLILKKSVALNRSSIIISDDIFDAILCALTGLLTEILLENDIKNEIDKEFSGYLSPDEIIPPKNYILLKGISETERMTFYIQER